ncbi:hypothetical protein KCU65_g6219, partial [Aureobasidium melanogenum]
MSSDASTSSSHSKEPPAKRLKRSNTDDYPYRPDMVLLGGDWPGPNAKFDASNVVACVHSAQFDQITKPGHRWNEAAARKDDFLSVRHIEFGQSRYFIEYIAHYAQQRNATAALNSSRPDNDLWHEHLFEVYRVICLEKGFTGEIHDSLIDSLLDSIRKDERDGALVKNVLLFIINIAYMSDMVWGEGTLADSSHLIKLLAVLALHHAKSLLWSHLLDEKENEFFSALREGAISELLKTFPPGESNTTLKDPLAEGFDQHCIYHVHGKNEPCYRFDSENEPCYRSISD